MREIDLDQLRSILLRDILENRTIQDTFQDAWNCIRLPMICFDVSFHLIAYAFERPCAFLNWEDLASRGYASEAVIMSYGYFDTQNAIYSCGEAQLRNQDNCKAFPQYCAPIELNGKLAAYCGIMIEDAVPEQVCEATNLLSSVVRLLLSSSEEYADDVQADVLLSEHLDTAADRILRARFQPEYVFAVISVAAPAVPTLRYVQGLLEERTDTLCYMVNSDMLYVLFSGLDTAEKENKLLNLLREWTEKYRVYAAVSDVFREISTLPAARNQALLAMAQADTAGGERKQFSSFFDSYCSIILGAALERLGSGEASLPELEALRREDGSCSGAYRQTLKSYLRNFQKASAVAEELGVHVNTVLRRIHKIEELLGYRIEDMFPQLVLAMETEQIAESVALEERPE